MSGLCGYLGVGETTMTGDSPDEIEKNPARRRHFSDLFFDIGPGLPGPAETDEWLVAWLAPLPADRCGRWSDHPVLPAETRSRRGAGGHQEPAMRHTVSSRFHGQGKPFRNTTSKRFARVGQYGHVTPDLKVLPAGPGVVRYSELIYALLRTTHRTMVDPRCHDNADLGNVATPIRRKPTPRRKSWPFPS